MKILWIVNTIFPYPAEQLKIEKCAFGGWLNGLANQLKEQDDVELGIATVYNGNEIKKYYDGKITYYLMPGGPALKYNSKLNKYCKVILDEFKPEILHIHGTEYAHGLSFINVCNDNVKKVVSIQGLTSCIGKVYLAGMKNKDIIKSITLRDILKNDNLFQQKNKFIKRGRIEKEVIKKCDYIIGRTDWDHFNSKAINNNAKYYCLYETVRKEFYENEWDINKIERNSIYLSQGSYPIKGLHILLETINLVKETYPNVKLYVSGNNIIKKDSIISKLKLTGYGKYINGLIKKYKLEDNIQFTGILNEEEVIKRLLKTHIVIVPSIIENESNSLTEAHLLGVPTIAAFSGGMTDRIIHKESGFLYPFSEPAMCAEYILEYFYDDNLAKKYGQVARKKALERNNPKENQKRVLEIYKDILGDTI